MSCASHFALGGLTTLIVIGGVIGVIVWRVCRPDPLWENYDWEAHEHWKERRP
jgi:hypothetical protein